MTTKVTMMMDETKIDTTRVNDLLSFYSDSFVVVWPNNISLGFSPESSKYHMLTKGLIGGWAISAAEWTTTKL